MGKSRTAQAIDKLLKDRIASEQFGRHLLQQTGAKTEIDNAKTEALESKQAVVNAELPLTDDGIAPTAPTNVTTTVFFHDVFVEWDKPPTTDYVKTTRVVVKRTDNSVVVKTLNTKETNVMVSGLLPGVNYTFDVRHEDMFTRLSTIVSRTATPEKTVAELITASTQVAAGHVSNLLNDPGLAAITDPGKLANEVVTRNAMAMANNPNILAWDQAEFANYTANPAVNGTNSTTSLVNFSGRKWLSHVVADTTTQNHVFPFGTVIKDHTEKEPGWYIWSVECFNAHTTVAANVQIRVQFFDDAGVQLGTATGDIVSIPPRERRQVFARFQRTSTQTQQRINVWNHSLNRTVYWNRFMLQKAVSDKAEPAPYVPPGFSTGSIAAELISAWTIAAGRAIIADATVNDLKVENGAINDLKFDRATGNRIQIQTADILDASITTAKIDNAQITNAKIANLAVTDAKINNLSASKIEAGNINAALNITAGGTISAGGASLGQQGVTLNTLSDGLGNPSSAAADWISPKPGPHAPTPFAGIGFFSSPDGVTPLRRGVSIRADGVAGTVREGNISMFVTNGDQDYNALTSAHLGILSQPSGGQIYMKQDAVVERDTFVKRDLDVSGKGTIAGNLLVGGRFLPDLNVNYTIAAGSEVTYTYPAGWPTRPFSIHVWGNRSGLNNAWRPAGEINVSVFMVSGSLNIKNNDAGSAAYVRVVIFK